MQLALDSRTEPIWLGYKRVNWANPSTVDSDFVTWRCTSCSLVQALVKRSEADDPELAKPLRIEEREPET